MSYPGWIGIKFWLFCISFRHRNSTNVCLYILPLLLLSTTALGDRTAFIEVTNTAKPVSDISYANEVELKLKVHGSYAKAGDVKTAEGHLLKLVEECSDLNDETEDRPLGEEWVAVLDYTHSPQTGTNTSNCHSLLDRVRNAMLFGASAIIILAMRPKLAHELDIPQIFSKPVVVIQDMENVTAILGALASKLKLHVKVAFNTSYYELKKISTLTLWSTCGRSNGVQSYNEWEGVVCLGEDRGSKADPAHFWYYFFSALGMILLLLIIKSKQGSANNDVLSPDYFENSMRRLAGQALQVMQCKQYSSEQYQNEDTHCAVCLDLFERNQVVRVIPCGHEFHASCVDEWLITRRTCPLCKMNILDNRSLVGCT